MISRTLKLKQFYTLVQDLWGIPGFPTQIDAYEEAERRYQRRYGHRMYLNYDSFKSCKHTHRKSGNLL